MGGVGDRIEIRDPRRGDENFVATVVLVVLLIIEIRDPRRGDENVPNLLATFVTVIY